MTNVLVAKSTRRNSRIGKKRSVRCIDTGYVYASSTDAADLLSYQGLLINPRDILYVCQGRGKSAGGLHWEYADAGSANNTL